MASLQCIGYVFILFILTSKFIVGFTKDCDCTETKNMVMRVRNVLLSDMFEMKLKNDMLTSKIDRLEQMFQEKLSVSVTSTTPDTSQTDGDKSKSLEVDTDTEVIQKTPEWELRLESLVHAFHSEKEQRLQMESVVRLELKTLNDSFKDFTTHMNAAFTKRINTITEDFENFKHNVTNVLSDFRNEYKSSIDDVEKLLSGVIETNLTDIQNSFNAFTTHMGAAFTKSVNSVTEKIKHFEKNVTNSLSDVRNEYKSSINDVQELLYSAIEKNVMGLRHELGRNNRDISRLNIEVSSVIDNAILNKTDSCEPSCSNGGVCFKDNTCRCKRFTEGTQCEKFFCDESCAKNGGECIGPGSCSCPDYRDGVNCEIGEADFPGIYFEGSTGSRLEYESLPSSLRIRFLLSLDLKTTDQDGVIFYTASKNHFDHISIIMKMGYIVCSFNSGTGTGKMTSPRKINDGKWHKLEFRRNLIDGFLQVDQDKQLTWSSPGRARTINTTPPFYFGGVNQSQLSDQAVINLSGVANSFKGCLANIKVNGEDTGTPSKMIGTKRCLDMEQK